MVILRTITSTNCPTEKHADALKLAAQTLAEIAGRTPAHVATITTFDIAVDALAALIPEGANITFASSLPAEMRRVVDECALFHTPRDRPSPTPNQAIQGNIVVDTVAERDAREKYVVVGGMKLWKASEHPWTCCYAHHWVGQSYAAWFAAYDTIVQQHPLPDLQHHRQRCCERLMRSWFEITSGVKTQEELTPGHVKFFQATVDLLVEAFLLRKNVVHAGS
jgi:hypothetical protein